MITKKIKGVEIEFYDSIDSMPTSRFMQFNKFFCMESISSPDMNAILDQEREVLRLLNSGRYEDVRKVVNNRSQALIFALNNVNPQSMAHACFIASVNGQKKIKTKQGQIDLKDDSDEAIKNLSGYINSLETRKGVIYKLVDELKKKLIAKLTRFFLIRKIIKK